MHCQNYRPRPLTRRDLLRQITVFWPEYKDIQDQLEALDSAIDALGPDGTAPSSGGTE